MKRLRVFLALLTLVLAAQGIVLGQGCVAVRPMSCAAHGQQNNLGLLNKGQWQVFSSYRYFESFRHFRGSEEEPNRVEDGTEVVNVANSMDLGIGTMFSNRLGLNLTLPIISYDRSSLYEHYGNSASRNPDQTRFHTGAFGIGDARITPNYWLFDPVKHGHTGNLSLGVGLKVPTGDSDVKDDFHRLTEDGQDTTIVRAVDQSIQLGDGGWGFTTEVQGYWNVNPRTSLFVNGFYLFNPRNTNGTLTRGTADGVDPLIVNHSVADQYAARLGVNTVLLPKHGLQGSLAGRAEGVPSKDVFGGSDGFRRPGYIVSVEPSLSLPMGNINMTLSVPIALYRNRVKSTYDLADPTGMRHGDAAFADYLINLNFSYRFSKNPFARSNGGNSGTQL